MTGMNSVLFLLFENNTLKHQGLRRGRGIRTHDYGTFLTVYGALCVETEMNFSRSSRQNRYRRVRGRGATALGLCTRYQERGLAGVHKWIIKFQDFPLMHKSKIVFL